MIITDFKMRCIACERASQNRGSNLVLRTVFGVSSTTCGGLSLRIGMVDSRNIAAVILEAYDRVER